MELLPSDEGNGETFVFFITYVLVSYNSPQPATISAESCVSAENVHVAKPKVTICVRVVELFQISFCFRNNIPFRERNAQRISHSN